MFGYILIMIIIKNKSYCTISNSIFNCIYLDPQRDDGSCFQLSFLFQMYFILVCLVSFFVV